MQATEARIDRWSHSVRIAFDEPASVRLSPEPWMDAYQSRATCRHILIDLLGGQDKPTALGEVGVSYRIDGKPLPRTSDLPGPTGAVRRTSPVDVAAEVRLLPR